MRKKIEHHVNQLTKQLLEAGLIQGSVLNRVKYVLLQRAEAHKGKNVLDALTRDYAKLRETLANKKEVSEYLDVHFFNDQSPKPDIVHFEYNGEKYSLQESVTPYYKDLIIEIKDAGGNIVHTMWGEDITELEDVESIELNKCIPLAKRTLEWVVRSEDDRLRSMISVLRVPEENRQILLDLLEYVSIDKDDEIAVLKECEAHLDQDQFREWKRFIEDRIDWLNSAGLEAEYTEIRENAMHLGQIKLREKLNPKKVDVLEVYKADEKYAIIHLGLNPSHTRLKNNMSAGEVKAYIWPRLEFATKEVYVGDDKVTSFKEIQEKSLQGGIHEVLNYEDPNEKLTAIGRLRGQGHTLHLAVDAIGQYWTNSSPALSDGLLKSKGWKRITEMELRMYETAMKFHPLRNKTSMAEAKKLFPELKINPKSQHRMRF